ncbi:MAG: hypothetical protein EON54_28750, partial [Alcaligenaceae bacterium]
MIDQLINYTQSPYVTVGSACTAERRAPSVRAAKKDRPIAIPRHLLTAAFAIAMSTGFPVHAQTAPANTSSVEGQASGETALLSRHNAMSAQLANNAFRRPLVLESTDSNGGISGNAYAVVDAPFNTVSSTFKSPARWCDVLILHLNTKQCKAEADKSPTTIAVHIGRKKPQELKDATLLAFDYRLVSASARYLAAQLNADKGPMGTSAYKIELHAVPVSEGKTFIHLRYSYGYN